MASHRHHRLHHCQNQPHLPPPTTTCCCNSSYDCRCPLSPPPSTEQLLQVIASLLPQHDPIPTYFQTHTHKVIQQNQYHKLHPKHCLHQENQTHSAIASLLSRIEALESYVHHFSSHGSLRDTAARIIQTHFRAFLVRRSRTLRQLKDLALIKSTFNSLKSLFSNETHIVDFVALSHKAMDLLLQLDSIQGGDPMIRDGKRSISRDLVQFLESIDGFVLKKHGYFVKTTKNPRCGQTQSIKKSRVLDTRNGNLGDDQRKLLKNLRDRVGKISQICELSGNDVSDDGGDHSVQISRRNRASQNKNGARGQRHVVQPKVKKSVSFADDLNISKVYSDTDSHEPVIGGDVTFLDGSSSGEDQGELLENLKGEVEYIIDSSQGVEDDEDVVVENGASPESSDGERNSKRDLKNDGRNEMKGQLHTQNQKVLFSAPMPLRMESRTDLMNSKGVRIVR